MEALRERLQRAQRIVVICGAGISTSAGIPDFRSASGLFEKYGPEVFSLSTFTREPNSFYRFYREFRAGTYAPTPTHRFLKRLQEQGKLMRVYTQNIDGLELSVGLDPGLVVQVHGHMRTANCAQCRRWEIPIAEFDTRLDREGTVRCPRCHGARGAYLKPSIVFYGEGLPTRFRQCLENDLNIKGFGGEGRPKKAYREGPFADLMLVLGTSLQVAPIKYVPEVFPGPRVYINAEPNAIFTRYADLWIPGKCDDVVGSL